MHFRSIVPKLHSVIHKDRNSVAQVSIHKDRKLALNFKV